MTKVSGKTSVASLAPHTITGALEIECLPALKGCGTESFSSLSQHFEVAVQTMTSPDAAVSTVMASILPTHLADAAFLYWDNLPPLTQRQTQRCFLAKILPAILPNKCKCLPS